MVSYFWFVGTLVLLSGSEQVSGFTLQGCYATYSNDPNLPFGLSSDSLTVSQCSDYCSQRNSLRAILQLNNCACFSKTDFDLTFFPVNIVECTANCTDSLPCGERVFRRYSVYDLTPSSTAISATPFASPTLGSPSNSTNSSSVTASPTLGASTSPSVNPNANASFNRGGGPDQGKIAIIVGVLVAAVLVTAAIAYVVYRRYRSQMVPTLPRLSSRKANTWLIPGILPRTPNLIYSVSLPFTPNRDDELALGKQHVVVLTEIYSDGWAIGTNVTTGATGVLPLVCLISEHESSKRHASELKIPSRQPNASLGPSDRQRQDDTHSL